MLKKISVLLFTTVIVSSSLSASVYKGHALFQKKCLSCHGKALEFVIDKTTDEWKEVMKDNGNQLLLIHIKEFSSSTNEEVKALKYFKGKRFPKNVKHYKDFLLEYSSDTGNIPACD